jgi:hypothetical protein
MNPDTNSSSRVAFSSSRFPTFTNIVVITPEFIHSSIPQPRERINRLITETDIRPYTIDPFLQYIDTSLITSFTVPEWPDTLLTNPFNERIQGWITAPTEGIMSIRVPEQNGSLKTREFETEPESHPFCERKCIVCGDRATIVRPSGLYCNFCKDYCILPFSEKENTTPIYDDSDVDGCTTCSICLTEIPDSELVVYPCGHCACRCCWILLNKNEQKETIGRFRCQECRQEFETKEAF